MNFIPVVPPGKLVAIKNAKDINFHILKKNTYAMELIITSM